MHKTVLVEENSISHDVFGLSFVSNVQCAKCSFSSKPVSTKRFIEYLYVSTFREMHSQKPSIPFEVLIKTSTQEFKGCPKDDDKNPCKDVLNFVDRQLVSLPYVATFGLVWPTNEPTPHEINSTLQIIRTTIDLFRTFETPFSNGPQKLTYQLRGMICYYGHHYNTYFYSPQHHCWIVFDDSLLSKVCLFLFFVFSALLFAGSNSFLPPGGNFVE